METEDFVRKTETNNAGKAWMFGSKDDVLCLSEAKLNAAECGQMQCDLLRLAMRGHCFRLSIAQRSDPGEPGVRPVVFLSKFFVTSTNGLGDFGDKNPSYRTIN